MSYQVFLKILVDHLVQADPLNQMVQMVLADQQVQLNLQGQYLLADPLVLEAHYLLTVLGILENQPRPLARTDQQAQVLLDFKKYRIYYIK